MFLEETLVLCSYVPVPVDGSGFWSWIRVSGGKKSGKVPLSVTWGFFFPFGWEGEGEASSVDGSEFWVLEMSVWE